MIIGGIGIFFMLLDALRHGMYLRRQVDIDSNVEAFTAAIVYLLLIALEAETGEHALQLLIVFPAARLLIHDTLVNAIRGGGHGINYLGTEAITDRLQQLVWDRLGLPPVVQKIIALVACVGLAWSTL